MRYCYIIFTSCLLVLSCANGVSQIKEINNQELIELMANDHLQLIDVRTPEEVDQGMIEGALNIDFRNSEFKNKLKQLDKNQPIAVYCGAGGRSAKSSSILKELGFNEIYDLTGGYSNWVEEKLPVTTPK